MMNGKLPEHQHQCPQPGITVIFMLMMSVCKLLTTTDHNCKYNSKILLEITGHPVAPVCLLLVLTLKGLTFTTIIKLPPFLEQYSILCS